MWAEDGFAKMNFLLTGKSGDEKDKEDDETRKLHTFSPLWHFKSRMVEPAGLIRVVYIDFSQLFIIDMSMAMHRGKVRSLWSAMCLTTTLPSTLRNVRVGDDRAGGNGRINQVARIDEVYKVLDKRKRKKVFRSRDNGELNSINTSWLKILGTTHFERTAGHFFNIFPVLAETRPYFVRSALKSTIGVNKLSDEGGFVLGIRLRTEDLDFTIRGVILCIMTSHSARWYLLARSSQNAAREVCNGAELKSPAESVMNWILSCHASVGFSATHHYFQSYPPVGHERIQHFA